MIYGKCASAYEGCLTSRSVCCSLRGPTATQPRRPCCAVFAIGEHLRRGHRKCRPCTHWHHCHRLRGVHCSFPRCRRRCRCRRGRHSRLRQPRGPRIAAAVPTMARVGSTETSTGAEMGASAAPSAGPGMPCGEKATRLGTAAATPPAAVGAVKGVGHLPLRDALSAPAAAASAELNASSAALGSGSRAAAAPQRAAAAPIDPVRQRVRPSGTR